MAKINNPLKRPDESKLSTSWGYVISAFAIFGAGFGVGTYYSSLNAKIEKQEILLEYQEKITDLKNNNILLEVKLERYERNRK